MKHLLSALLSLALTACGYGWEEKPPAYPPAKPAGGSVVGTPVAEGEYQVQAGDTLYAIGFRNQVDYRDLAVWNGIDSDYLIRSGQILRLTPPPGSDGVLIRPLPTNSPIIANSQRLPDGPQLGPVTQAPIIISSVPVLSVPPVPRPVSQGASPLRWLWPTSGDVIRSYNIAAGSKGIDVTGQLGQPIYAVAAGKVVYSGSALKGYGELIIIKHDDTYLSAYGHNRRRLVKEGDEVRAGQTIAELGIGPEQKPILHFEIRENGKPVDPLGFLPVH